jgi:serine/threonine-protein kinase
MANLYLARFAGPEGFEKLVAIKRIHEHLSANPEFIQMFIDEARLAARIAHPSVAQVLELGTVGHSYFIAMEYVEGETLTSVVRLVKPEYPISARIIANAAAGLHAAHELRSAQGQLLQVVHRDVSPGNILITYEGAVKVVDFGVARARGKLHSTAVGVVKGKLAYMSPEQAEHREVDRRADIFALGIILYELTTWHRLFRAETESETVAKVCQCEIVPPSVFVDDYPPQLETIVLRALRKDPDLRYQTAQELSQDLEQFIVSCGAPVPQSVVGELMASLFSERMQEKQAMISACADLPEIPDLQEPQTGSSLSLEAVGPRRRGRLVVIALVVALVLGGGVAGYLMWRKPPVQVKVTTPQVDAARRVDAAPARPRPDVAVPEKLVKISIRVTPATAKIAVDGVDVGNPYEVRQKAGTGTARVEISAPKHLSQTIDVPLAEGGSWVIALQPERKAIIKVRPKKPGGEDPLFPSPYKNKKGKK